MEPVLSSGLLDEHDGLSSARALILQAYYAMRRTRLANKIGTREIKAWIARHEPTESLPSDSLILLTLGHTKIAHRPPGRPRRDDLAPAPAPFFCPPRRRPP